MSPATEDGGDPPETLRQAIKASMRLREAIRATDEDALKLEHATALGLKHWVVDEDMLIDSTTLLQRLPAPEKMLTQTSCEVSAMDDTPTDDQAVARASGGAVVFGHCIGFHGSSKSVKTAILQTPIEWELETPTMSTDVAEAWFASASDANDFQVAVHSSGHARPLRDGSHLPPRGSSGVTYCREWTTAKDFLFDYSLHVHSGTSHVGGSFWKTTMCPADQAPKDLSMNYSSFPYQSRVDACESTLQDELRTRCNTTTQIECTGPDALSVAIFKQRLALDCATWHVIDYPTTHIGVWDLLAAAGYEQAANLVRDAGLDLVAGCEMIPDVEAAVHAVYTEAWVTNPTFGTHMKCTNVGCADDADETIAQLLDAATAGKIDDRALVDITSLALRYGPLFEETSMANYMRDRHLHTSNMVAETQMPIFNSFAVKHLLDGFPLELMNGDAGMVNDK
ncbi:hypothetical protein SPRG_02570 [Saprolegnia parasitica CBS 223.65]|uniref:Uncharacterized protein n=1 Tax=Saprolegnia parasitica (strain CBS 223.65) TaxID=695850 RepID=A0A067CQU2_SAPPC|nr:hypothetical protein SPRG_02570 [Saprolegnia parasitica CBS 223.65]KDO32878.1 hypothetical protein SPRG_02570 [Saprolegnia parasitica CBS 223.65]|eukprot:XP_012196529.1 hypothetical protein SPRG_02570 [Saprolegnia parasitica CBS 223.65]